METNPGHTHMLESAEEVIRTLVIYQKLVKLPMFLATLFIVAKAGIRTGVH